MRRTIMARVAVVLAIGSLITAIVPGVAAAARPAGSIFLPAVAVDAGDAHACAIVETDGAFCWGDNTFKQLGNYDQVPDSSTPLPVDVDAIYTYLGDVASISAGEATSCVAQNDGAAWCWGAALVGDGTGTASILPSRVIEDGASALTGVTQVSAGSDVACARTDDGGAWCWGAAGETGDGTLNERTGAVRVRKANGSPLTGVVAVSAGSDHACAVTTSGAGWCWGDNTTGQLGDGTKKDRRSAVRVTDARGQIGKIVSISAGTGFTCISKTDGSAWCWGDGFWGNLGNGGTGNSNVAVRVTAKGGLPAIAQVSAGDSHACAAARNGSAWCWGSNLMGELGNGTHKRSSVAVQVLRGAKTLGKVTAISAGNTFTCAYQGVPESVWCWGANADGEIGDGTDTDRYVATLVRFSYPSLP